MPDDFQTQPYFFPQVTRLATFLDRPNRFTAEIVIEGQRSTAHINSGGRMQELLTPGRSIAVTPAANPERSTAWDLKLVKAGGGWMNLDSMLANRLVGHWLKRRELPLFGDYDGVRAEVRHGDSRFDFELTGGTRRTLIEVKNVTLCVGDWGVFPDAPTTRGAKHVRELALCARDGMRCAVIWIMAHPKMRRCWAHPIHDPEFTAAVIDAREAGVQLIACHVHLTRRCATVTRLCPVEPLDERGRSLLERHVKRFAGKPLLYARPKRRRAD